MYVWLFTCVLLLGGLATDGVSLSAPAVSMSEKLRGSLVGRTVSRRLEGFVGKDVEFVLRHRGTDRYYSGKIDQVIVPDIADYIRSGNHDDIGFMMKVSAVQPDDGTRLPDVVEMKNIVSIGIGRIGYVQYINSASLGEEFPLARLLTEYKDTGGKTFWEALIEVKSDVGQIRELEKPFIVLLSEQEDFLKIFPL